MIEVFPTQEDVFLMGQLLKHLVVHLQYHPGHRPFLVVLPGYPLVVLLLYLLEVVVAAMMRLLH